MASFGHRGGTMTTISVPGTSAGRGRCAQRSQASTPRGGRGSVRRREQSLPRLHSDRGGEGSGGVGGSITPHPARYARHPLPWERAEVSRFQRSPFFGDQPFPRGRGSEFLHPQRSPFWRISSFPWGGGWSFYILSDLPFGGSALSPGRGWSFLHSQRSPFWEDQPSPLGRGWREAPGEGSVGPAKISALVL